jgi:hypothetical protein
MWKFSLNILLYLLASMWEVTRTTLYSNAGTTENNVRFKGTDS